MTLKNKNILVSGATGGLGKAVVELFLKENANVIVTYFSENSFSKLRDGLKNPQNLIGYRVDLSSSDEVEKSFKDFKNIHIYLDEFIHLAGGFWMGGILADTSVEAWNNMINQNLNATFYACRQAFQLMKLNGGHILTIAAKSAVDLPGGMGAYAVSKSGVLALTKILAKEGKDFAIRANCLLPGTIDTPANRKAMPDSDFTSWVPTEEIARKILSFSKNSALSGSIIEMYGKIS